jgi:L-malate glycosyltransferase
MKILHITNWYYSEEEPNKVPFIKEHLKALQLVSENTLVHVEVQDDGKHQWKKTKGNISEWETYRILKTRKIPWKLKEILSSRLLLKTLKEYDVNQNFDVLNIHTAYPLCTSIKKILKKVTIPVVFTEHWTAFSFNFNLDENAKSLDTIRAIYKNDVPVITVSNTLGLDIKRFSRTEKLNYHIVPNVVNDEIFNYKENSVSDTPSFFMVNYWREIKSPFVIFEAFKQLLLTYPKAQLRVGGYGPLWSNMISFVEEHKLEKSIILLGKLEKVQIAEELQSITAFVHAAKHETFSVVTAEALMCGTPVAVSDLPCIAEYVNESNGILVKGDWTTALKKMIQNKNLYNRKEISLAITNKFSKSAVADQYYNVLLNVKENHYKDTL